MHNSIIEKTIEISTTPDIVWRVFTDPFVTRQMGGEYVSEWKVGSSFGWKSANGKMLTKGKILQIEDGKFLKHSLFNQNGTDSVISVITYTFKGNNNKTILSAREELSDSKTVNELDEISGGWDAALAMIKQLSEKL